MNNKLKPGCYMKVSNVHDIVEHKFGKWSLSSIIKQVCEVHEGEFNVYYSTSDLKNVMVKPLFHALECECTTHMILDPEELAQPLI
jgi:hypothetical protein